MAEVAAMWIEGLVLTVAQVARGHDAERASRRQRATFGATDSVVVVTLRNVLALKAARQIDLSHEHVARVNVAVVIAIVQAAATAAAEIALAIIVSRIVRQRGSNAYIRASFEFVRLRPDTRYERNCVWGERIESERVAAIGRAELAGGAGRGRPARRAGASHVTGVFGAEDGWGCPATGPASYSSAFGDAL
jgi:hypothetical protein